MSTADTKAVFLSYASQDAEAVRRIAEALRAAGVEVWFDQSELVGGDAWDAKIRKQIKECALFVPIISANTQARLEGYFRLEWKLAAQRTHTMAEAKPFLMPICIDDTRDADAHVPEEFRAVQWTPLRGAMVPPQLVAQVRHILGFSPASVTEHARVTPAMPPVREEDRTRHNRPILPRWIWTVAALLAFGLAAFFVTRNAPAPTAASKPAAGAPVAPDKSIAVLPFVNLGADKADEYLGDGMTEELLHVLAKVKALRVPGRSSSFAFKGRVEEGIFRRVGEQLRVSTVLEGSVRKSGNRLRITAQLINVADGFHLWSETYDREITDILAIQSEVAQRVVQALQVQLGVDEIRTLAKKATSNPAAHDQYLKGRFYHYQFTDQGSKAAIECFKQAIALDAGYAEAYAGMAAIYAWISSVYLPPNEAMPVAKRYVMKALELEDSLPEAHHSFACVKWWGDWDFPGAEREFKRAIELNPNEARVRGDYAGFLMQQGRFSEAVVEADRAAILDPQTKGTRLEIHIVQRQYDRAYAYAQLLLGQKEISPKRGHHQLALVCVFLGRLEEAASHARQALKLSDEPQKMAEARSHLAAIIALTKQIYVSPVRVAELYEALGERDLALEWLQTAYEIQCDHLLPANVHPGWDSIRNDPRFQTLLKKIGLIK